VDREDRVNGLEVGIVARDVDRLTAFYVAAFGFELVKQLEFPQGRVTRLATGHAALKVYQPADAPSTGRSPDAWRTASGFAYASAHVTSAAAALERAVAAGALQVEPVTRHRPGACYAMVADPEGNIWELLEEHDT
jgi:uncharacterized glyoxalase superfamily protein PhnB